MFEKSKKGFTLLELVVAMAIIGIMAAIAVPLIRPKSPRVIRETFISQLNSLVSFASQNAIVTGKIHNVDFNFVTKKVTACVGFGSEVAGKNPIKSAYTSSSILIPDQLQIVNFYIEGEDVAQFREAYFYVTPDGFTQSVIINMFDTKDKIGRRNRRVSLVLNPFSVQFEVYNEFKRPS